MYTLERHQLLAAKQDRVWNFLQDPANLDRITPPDLHFEIVSPVPAIMYDGLIVAYRISIPLLGTHSWVTEIKHIRPGHSFVDEQRLGPYKFWYHYHEIRPEGSSVAMLDRVYYQPPLGPIGSLLQPIYIGRTLDRIFNYRQQRLAELLS